jgi:DNA polymerase-3 subunit gamma/tau
MSEFIVSARKYRPIRFDSVVGQSHISNTLKNALRSNHLAHAFLFCGPRGVGKTTCARILAKVLNCDQPTADYEPCDTCNSCKAFRENSSMNVYELDAASNNSVEHIRTLIEQVRFAPQHGRYKIYIIDEVHMLSQAAFNAFLKTLEEPPSYAIFILATTEKHKIIPTILSRCQIFDFKRIQISDMATHLGNICQQEGISAQAEALHVIAQKADGALRDALSIFDRIVSFSGQNITYQHVIDNLNILDYDYFFKVTDALLTENTAALLDIFDMILEKGFDGEIFIGGLAEHLRNLLVCKDPQTQKLLDVAESIKTKYAQQSGIASRAFLMTALSLLNDCDIHYKMSRNKRLHIEIYLLKMAYINRTLQVQTVSVASLEKKTLILN